MYTQTTVHTVGCISGAAQRFVSRSCLIFSLLWPGGGTMGRHWSMATACAAGHTMATTTGGGQQALGRWRGCFYACREGRRWCRQQGRVWCRARTA